MCSSQRPLTIRRILAGCMPYNPIALIVLLFFFSSRRRHTRFDCDWSSDVCSSDLLARTPASAAGSAWSGTVPSELEARWRWQGRLRSASRTASRAHKSGIEDPARSEEHTSELQSQSNLVCRLLLEKKKNTAPIYVS